MSPTVRRWLKSAALLLATVVITPALLSFWLRSRLLGPDRALHGSTEWLSLIPGLTGQYLRRAFLMHALQGCHSSVTVGFGTLFSQAGTRIEANVYIGPHCHIGLVHLERDVLLASGVHVPSGPHTHGIDEPAGTPGEKAGELRRVRIGARTWVGSAAVVMADVGQDAVIGAGAVVTKAIPDRAVAAGVPARVLRTREAAELSAEPPHA